MGTMQWREHFASSVRRDRRVSWDIGVHLPEPVREPVLASLQTFQRGLTSPGMHLRTRVRQQCPAEYADCVDLYVQEKNIHAELLAQLLWRTGSEPTRRAMIDFAFRRVRRRFDWAREMMILLTAEMASMPFFRVLSSSIDDAVTRQVLESIMADQSYHLGFHIDHLRPELEERDNMERLVLQQAWSAMFGSLLGVIMVDNRDVFRALGYERLTYWTDAWNLFAQVQSGLTGSPHLASVIGRDPRLKFAL